MPRIYSDDFRFRVVALAKEGKKTYLEISKLFKISVKTIYIWRKKYEKTGSVKQEPIIGKGHSHRITDWDKFRNFVKKNSGKTRQELADLWKEKTGISISVATMGRALGKIEFTHKKKLMGT